MKIRLLQLSAALLVVSALNAQVVTIGSLAEYNKHYNSDKPMVTMYTATWCGPCKSTKPHFKALSKEYTNVTFCMVDTDKFSGTLAKGIKSIPTFVFSNNGNTIKKVTGGKSRQELETYLKDSLSKINNNTNTKAAQFITH